MKNIFDYLDYRDYLKDVYRAGKRRYGFYSYRYISQKTGIDASFFVKVIQKQKHIADKAIPVLSKFLNLKKRESDYFTTLVYFNKAKTQEKIKFYFEKMIALRAPHSIVLEKEKYQYFSSWYNIAIRELINILPFSDDYASLGARLLPPISAAKAKASVRLLEQLDLIRKDENGRYKITDNFVSTDGVVRSISVRTFQKEMAQLGKESIERVPKTERDVSTITLSTSKTCLKAIQERLAEVRHEIIQMVEMEKSVEEVYQLNFQIFPLTQNTKQPEES